jgi:hypothetical protein
MWLRWIRISRYSQSNTKQIEFMKIAITLTAAIILGLFALTSWSNNKTIEAQKEMGVGRLPNGVRIYEVTRDGIEYIIVEKHSGLGICRK